jgi:glycosyltransferase involved in cell wall biosynthesis
MPEETVTRDVPGAAPRIAWSHTFNPLDASRGSFMYTAAEGLRRTGANLHLEYLGSMRSPARVMEAVRRVQELAEESDIIHAQYGSACGLVSSAASRIPKVLSLRGSDWNVMRQWNASSLHTLAAHALTRLSLSRYDAVVTVSRRMAKEVSARHPDLRVLTLPSPVNLERFKARDREEARALLRRSGCRKKWVLFNALNPRDPLKRFPLARRAFDLANQRRGDLELRVASELPHDVLPIVVAACDVVLCTSVNEGWPNSVKEGLAANVPFVATDVGDLASIAAEESACRVARANPASLADALCDVLDMGPQSNLQRFVASMSISANSAKLVELYAGLLGVAEGRSTHALPA